LLAQEAAKKQEPAPKAEPVKVEAKQLPVSSQGKKGETTDIVLTCAHATGAVPCEKNAAPGGCSAAEHWRVHVKFGGTDAPGKAFALADTELLKNELEMAASPKAKTKHADRVNLSDATMSIRVPAAMPYAIVQSLLTITACSGIHRLEFAVVPAADAAEVRLPVPLPTDEQIVLVDDPKTAPEDLRVVLTADAKTGASTPRFGRTVVRDNQQLEALIKDAHADRVRIGQPKPCIIDAAAGVPWQAVVNVIDACHAAGVRVEFAAPRLKK
jgi:biopolymer transport protein ExbD